MWVTHGHTQDFHCGVHPGAVSFEVYHIKGGGIWGGVKSAFPENFLVFLSEKEHF